MSSAIIAAYSYERLFGKMWHSPGSMSDRIANTIIGPCMLDQYNSIDGYNYLLVPDAWAVLVDVPARLGAWELMSSLLGDVR